MKRAALTLCLLALTAVPTCAAPELVVAPPQSASPVPEELRPALMLGAEDPGNFTVSPGEERLPAGEKFEPCFDPRCGHRLARRTGVTHVLLSALRPLRNGNEDLVLALYFADDGEVHALRRRIPNADSLIPLARAAAADLIAGRGEIAGGRWDDIQWLSTRDSTDRRRSFRYGLFAALAVAGGVALAQDQERTDPVALSPLTESGVPTADPSSLRGFFASPPQDARSQGREGAGASLSPDALSVLLNPAALGLLTHPNVVLARSLAPDGSPLLSAAFASPTRGYWTQGVALYYAGDGLESEATLGWAGAYDLQGIEDRFAGILLGATGKLYLAQAGEDGTGEDRSRGRATGMGLDLGAVLPLEDRLKVSFVLRDLPGFLWERNDFTNDAETETLPPEFRAGAAARATDALQFFLEGERALAADAPVHIRIGAEQELFRILQARAGYHEVFGEESVRLFSVGFGIDTRTLRSAPSLAVEFAFEYGLDDHEDLVGSQDFSLEFQF